jgi:hypothetical protein
MFNTGPPPLVDSHLIAAEFDQEGFLLLFQGYDAPLERAFPFIKAYVAAPKRCVRMPRLILIIAFTSYLTVVREPSGSAYSDGCGRT